MKRLLQTTDAVAGICGDGDVADCNNGGVLRAIGPDNCELAVVRPAHLRHVMVPVYSHAIPHRIIGLR